MRLGGGAFGNDDAWIDDAMLRALRLVGRIDLDVVVMTYSRASQGLKDLVMRTGFVET